MVTTRISPELCTLHTSDGQSLNARWWQGTEAHQRSLVMLSGLGAPQAYLSWFAGYFAKQGWGVLTFDYRGIGGSEVQAESGGSLITADTWIQYDLPAAVAEVKRRVNPSFLGVVAHSIGGQLLGQSPIRHEVQGALFIAAQRGIPKLFQGRSRLKLCYAYRLFPLLIHLKGELPVSKWTLPQPCPPQTLLQWMKWGRKGKMTDYDGNDTEPLFADYQGPITTCHISDDHDYAPLAAVKALAKLYTQAKITTKIISPEDYEREELGHFGLFHRHTPRELWADLEADLKTMYLSHQTDTA